MITAGSSFASSQQGGVDSEEPFVLRWLKTNGPDERNETLI